MGKRVDFSARSVITPDPNISIDELGVPIKIAMNLTYPEIVNPYNIEELKQCVLNGPDNYYGAKYVRKTKEERTIRLKNMNRSEIILEYGDIVERHLKDGDYVLFNRQPSLHRSSMMAHKVKITKCNTFGLNVMVTPSFNADFDGDEMNMHVAQSMQSHEELVQLAAVPTQIISPREGKPLISIVQDIVVGIHRMTKSHVQITQKQLFNLMALNPACNGKYMPPKYESKKLKWWSGQQILTTIMPKKINMYLPNNQYDENKQNKEQIVIIKNGEVVQGVFDKDTYQARTVGIVHSIYNEYGPEDTKIFFDNTQKLICNWLVLNGFSVGISDLIVDENTNKSFQVSINEMKTHVHKIISSIHANTFENKSTKNNSDDFEKKVNDILNEAIKKVGDSGVKHIGDNNRMISMVNSKSKGNVINVSQMIGCLGQQNVEGNRIPYGFDDRTLPHYTKYDDGPEARGFVENSFIKGLTPQEFFFSAMGGREGLIDTAVQTSETGYIQRKLVKAMEDCKVSYDFSVRNASGTIIQFLYGEDGMDSSKIESQKIPTIDVENVRKEFSFTKSEMRAVLAEDVYNHVEATKETWKVMMAKHLDDLESDRLYLITKLFHYKIENSVLYPVSLQRIINIAKGIYSGPVSDLTPEKVLRTIESLCEELYINKHHRGNKLFHILIRSYLSPKQVIIKHKLCNVAFDYIVEHIRTKFVESLAHPSEMVGVIAAQSIGEPATQLTLNTFHLAGVSAASKTVRGVPRLKEILSVSKNMKTPTMKIHFKEEYKFDQAKCLELMNNIRIVRFKDIVTTSKIFFDPNNCYYEDVHFIEQYKLFASDNEAQSKTSPWLLRLQFDKESMLKYSLDMIQIHQKLLEYYGDNTISCKFNDDNDDNLIFRIKLNLSDSQITNADDTLTELKALEYNILEKLIIKGTENIEKVTIVEEDGSRFNPVTGKFEKQSECVVYTDGTNLKEIFSIPYIDHSITTTNNINEIYEVFGIEAARQALYDEIQEVMDSITINYRHTSLLIDVMTNKGYIISIDRHGINRGDIGPLAKCSFEETTDKLVKAGMYAEYDKMNGVSANIILGQIVPAGTGDVHVIIDENKLPAPDSKMQDEVVEETITIEQCEEDNFSFDFVMPQKNNLTKDDVQNNVLEEEDEEKPKTDHSKKKCTRKKMT
jgi:DNA-directed RNA polymerase II subunit RPB1